MHSRGSGGARRQLWGSFAGKKLEKETEGRHAVGGAFHVCVSEGRDPAYDTLQLIFVPMGVISGKGKRDAM